MRLKLTSTLTATAALLAVLCAGAAASSGAGPQPAALSFDDVFSIKGEPAATHFQATYTAGGAGHQLEVWRDAMHIRRHTDARSETYAVRERGGAGYRMAVLDLQKKIRTDIDRDNLYRIGHFSDWYDLGHGLRHPQGTYQLTAATAPAGAPAPVSACTWFDLQQGSHTTHLCWSKKSRLPLLMLAQDGSVVWRITALDHHAVKPDLFAVHDAGFIRNDANRDIEQD